MSSEKETIYYMELRAGDAVQDGDQFRDVNGQWKPYTFLADMGGKVGLTVTARRPIQATRQAIYEEVCDSRTLQQAVEQPQRERWAYEELRLGDLMQEGDEWRNPDGRWNPLVLTPGASMEVRDVLRARRPHNITASQKERDEFQTALIESRLALNRKVAEVMEVCKERDNAENALKSAQRARDELQRQVDELRAGLMGVVSAEHVYAMLEDMLDQTEWVGQCLDSSTYEQMSCIQRTISMIAQRVNDMGKEGTSAND